MSIEKDQDRVFFSIYFVPSISAGVCPLFQHFQVSESDQRFSYPLKKLDINHSAYIILFSIFFPEKHT